MASARKDVDTSGLRTYRETISLRETGETMSIRTRTVVEVICNGQLCGEYAEIEHVSHDEVADIGWTIELDTTNPAKPIVRDYCPRCAKERADQ